MKLLTFAHRGEAQHFLKYDNYKSLDIELNGLYKNKENYLLITGEGLQSAQERITEILSQPNLNIEKVINLGIAGALDENLKLNSIYSIKKIKKENSDETFQSSDVYANIDCISALNRVHDEIYRTKLSKHAQIVDREIWSFAKVCKDYKIKLYSFKLISDYAGSTTELKIIISKSRQYSKKLYEFYNEFIKINQDR